MGIGCLGRLGNERVGDRGEGFGLIGNTRRVDRESIIAINALSFFLLLADPILRSSKFEHRALRGGLGY